MLSDEEYSMIPRVYLYGILGAGVVIMLIGIAYAVAPLMMEGEREIQVRSPQYVEARRTEVLDSVAECRTINSQLAASNVSEELRRALELEKGTLRERANRALLQLPVGARGIDVSACRNN